MRRLFTDAYGEECVGLLQSFPWYLCKEKLIKGLKGTVSSPLSTNQASFPSTSTNQASFPSTSTNQTPRQASGIRDQADDFKISGFDLRDALVGQTVAYELQKLYRDIEKRIAEEIADIEKDTGFKLRVLAQNYPDTPGLAIKDYWHVDDKIIVFVADPTFGNILNFNVGAIDVPHSFWNRLTGKYGNIFYWKEKGEDVSIESAVMAISNCLREPVGPNNCSVK
ncbi:hypothetical protein GIB67_026716 [Kingdonia uniflora]|uniref:Uncharacterized protein n=1 Tax=Kingdonia uniflora TaxID=39325 RepID=A0A7J7M281_9MAGN|nr:hypothetical protein GIB67_026716 [Kingdonia uniflora]